MLCGARNGIRCTSAAPAMWQSAVQWQRGCMCNSCSSGGGGNISCGSTYGSIVKHWAWNQMLLHWRTSTPDCYHANYTPTHQSDLMP